MIVLQIIMFTSYQNIYHYDRTLQTKAKAIVTGSFVGDNANINI